MPSRSTRPTPLDEARIAVLRTTLRRRRSVALDAQTYREFRFEGINNAALDRIVGIMHERGELLLVPALVAVTIQLAEPKK